MYLKICSPFLAAIALFTLTDTGKAQNIIGWNYDGQGADTLAAGELAGASGFEQLNWNNHAATSGSGPFALNNNLGLSSGASVTAISILTNNSWKYDEFNSPNEKLLNAWADQQPSITISGIPASFQASGYSLVIYYGNNEGPSDSLISISGSVNDVASRMIRTGNTAAASFRNVGFLQETGALTGSTNYTVFTGLNDPSFTIAMNDPLPSNNNGIAAFQIVAVPEPTSFVLVALGAAALGLRRRRS